jgi:hypothetical protein
MTRRAGLVQAPACATVPGGRQGDPGLEGVHEAHDAKGNRLTWDEKTGTFGGKPAYNKQGDYKEASITIYKDSINNLLPSDRSRYNEPGLTKEEFMVATLAHEAEHDLNKQDIAEIRGRYEGKGTHYNVDDFHNGAAYKMSKKVLAEIP